MNEPIQILNRNYGGWPSMPLPKDLVKFQTKPCQPSQFQTNLYQPSQPWTGFAGRSWKGKKGVSRSIEKQQRKDKKIAGGGNKIGGGGGGVVKSTLNELQSQSRLKVRKFYPKKKYINRFAPFAPRNTTSFLIRAKKAGGIASLVSPCPVTPAILPTPMFSPSREVLVDMAREEWGVDGYGSMNGLIRLRSPGHDGEVVDDEEAGEDSSGSDVEEHVEVERRLDHDLSRFEMIYPNDGDEQANLLENRVDDQDSHLTQLEEENLTLKERLYLMEKEMVDLRRRLLRLETEKGVKDEKHHDQESENEGGDVCSEKSVGGGDCDSNGPALINVESYHGGL